MATGSLQVNRDIILATKKQRIKQMMKQTPLDAVLALAQMQQRPQGILNYSTDGDKITLMAQLTRHEVYDPITSALHCLHNGADAVALFTDHSIYDDDFDDLLLVSRALPTFPVLFQNYVVNEYMVMAARASGASGLFLYSSLIDKKALRGIVSMAQRWKMSTIVQVSNQEDLETALKLSPHALAFGDNLSSNVAATVESLRHVRASLPSFYKILLTHTLRSLDDVALALEAGVDCLIVDELMLTHERTAHQIRNMIANAEAKAQS